MFGLDWFWGKHSEKVCDGESSIVGQMGNP